MNKKVLLLGTAFSILAAYGYARENFGFSVPSAIENAQTVSASEQTKKTAATATTVDFDPIVTNIFNAGSAWKFNDQGQDLGTAWKDTNFDDANWASGNAPLGYGDSGMATTLSFGPSSSNKYPTYYFRKTFNVADASAFDELKFSVQRDDGVVVYVNGVEAFRSNMAAGTIAYSMFSAETIDGAAETAWNDFVTSNLLVDGDNVIAIELHQRSAGSSDTRLDFKLDGISEVDPILFAAGSNWSYNDLGQDLATAWSASDYDDTNWQTGNAPLGYGDSGMATTLSFGPSSSSKYPTYYFRKTISVPAADVFDQLKFNVQRDDGVIIYVNGAEVLRSNMPAGTVGYNTFSAETIDGGAETAWNEYIVPNTLVDGENVIAIELHQRSAGSSDTRLDVSLEGLAGSDEEPQQYVVTDYPIAKDSQWKYSDAGTSFDGQAWYSASNDVTAWSHNFAPLGYGDPVNTIISFGPDASNKFPTTYFVKDINVDLADVSDMMELGVRRDDGVVIYVNGVEAVRSNLPAGTVNYSTLALTNVANIDENIYQTYLVPKTALQQGVNRIAVELHNDAVTSSDMRFDLYLKNYEDLSIDCNDNHISCFTSIQPTGQTPVLIYPQEHQFQLLFKEGDAYMSSTEANIATVPGLHDYTAYVGIANSSANGYLSVNHENTPGGVSIIDLHLNPSTLLWEKTDSRAVDFYNPVLVSTTRNCSGGVTLWGTVVTAEESTNAGDNNSDGYQDVGWLVEIDPVTAKVRDYGQGQEKLWAMGRMNHENVVISNDGTTAYYGEDGGTNCVYKYVMDTPGDLRNGTVYVLKLNLALSGQDPSSSTGVWVEVPNDTQADRNSMSAVAVAVGGTSFNGVEDVEINPVNGKIFFTAKGFDRVYDFIDNGTTVSEFETFVGGKSYDIETGTATFTEPWGDGNDNLTFDDRGNLWVCQDGGLNYIWMITPDHNQSQPRVKLWGSMPAGSEPTGLTFTPDYKYGFFSIQHPNGSNAAQMDATDTEVTINASASLVFSNENNIGLAVEDVVGAKNTSRVYPNPTGGVLFVELASAPAGKVSVEVVDLTGKTVYSAKDVNVQDAQRIELDLTPYIERASMYILKVKADGKQESFKVITK
ncbi:MAG: DUF839 domain-containing protein [Flavobacterium sp.]|uniref:alkaline phosphatase PhoX n=1 Tax=Flavobacterium sp. TaxID=239 RepID=UPI0011F84631|nr:alkaline phosphatase PhoX [Flavobacterium sp.]RZJ66750.1 MAG: DUF839 domain-containing protein [Flavobacterium sp.]